MAIISSYTATVVVVAAATATADYVSPFIPLYTRRYLAIHNKQYSVVTLHRVATSERVKPGFH